MMLLNHIYVYECRARVQKRIFKITYYFKIFHLLFLYDGLFPHFPQTHVYLEITGKGVSLEIIIRSKCPNFKKYRHRKHSTKFTDPSLWEKTIYHPKTLKSSSRIE